VPRSGFSWDTYSYLLESGDLDVDIAPWENCTYVLASNLTKHFYTSVVHPELHFVTHIPQTILGEQLVAQLFRCIPEKSWLFKYGRIPMSFILADWVWRVGFLFGLFSTAAHTFQRISAPPKRCKLSVIAEASSHFFPSLPPERLSPFLDHFHPAADDNRVGSSGLRPEARRRGSPFLAVNVVPHDEQVCRLRTPVPLTEFSYRALQLIGKGKLDQWDYILRRLFVLKSTPLRRAISSLAPGADVLLKSLTDKNLPPEQRVDVRLTVKQLTISDWALIARAFDAWPFAPSVCPFTNVPGRELNELAPFTQDLNIDSFVNYEKEY
jgi:transcription factor 1